MIPFGGMLTDEEIWTVMQYEHSFAGGHGRRGMGRHEGMGPMDRDGKGRGQGQHGGMGKREHQQRMDGEGCCEEHQLEN
jgi:hypothetical protein